jgi:hypothetical protein
LPFLARQATVWVVQRAKNERRAFVQYYFFFLPFLPFFLPFFFAMSPPFPV